MDGVVARHTTRPVVLMVRRTEVRACHAGCFDTKLESDESTGWWNCRLCGEDVAPLPERSSSGLWPGAAIQIPSSSREAVMSDVFTEWIAAWLEVPVEAVEVSISWS